MFDIDSYISYVPALWQGLLVTLALTAASLALGGCLAGALTVLRATNRAPVRKAVAIYIAFFRGTPLLAQLFFIYYGSGQFEPWLRQVGVWVFFRDPVFCAVLAFSMNTAAYQAEIIRGAVNSIQRGQLEAARAMGFDDATLLTRFIFPLGMRTAIRPYGNEVILMLKGSAVASVVAIYDLLGASKVIFSNTYDYRIYLLCGATYVVMVEILRRVLGRVERRLNPGTSTARTRYRNSGTSGHAPSNGVSSYAK
ncbi:Polar amino acid ABC transporter inner membrane subunit [Burkholderia aenigmatica]|uniref:Polar amino acid ABC transporter inner membrane subunit n=1 Tax=Burkholderia aenigmatica TaxID=2015348 RepID=A0A6P2I7C4_9BURK|nr:ABC transporter permease subunit [Burkholderia aenigmatica]VWB26529.1 Polar amino acid ABC transporter inner membrane subunit [Burkholderia aenigmatica]